MPARVSSNAFFLNIPYDQQFRSLYLAYIVGLMQLGLEPRVTLGLPGGARRLDRILELIQGCRYSIHDPFPCGARLHQASDTAVQHAV